MLGRPSSLQHYEFITHLLLGALQECQQAEEFLQEPSDRRLANFVQPPISLPRTTKDKPVYSCMPINDGKTFFSRTSKCYLRQGQAHNPVDSKINPLARACERQANREPSLILGVGRVSWLMMGLVALTRQKQLAKSRQAASQPAPRC